MSDDKLTTAQEDLIERVRERGWVMTGSIPFEEERALVKRGLLVGRMNPNGRRQSGFVLPPTAEAR